MIRIQDQLVKLRRNQERRQQRKAAREAAKAAVAAADSTFGLPNKDKKTDTIVIYILFSILIKLLVEVIN